MACTLHSAARQRIGASAMTRRGTAAEAGRTWGMKKIFSKCGDLYIVSYVFRHAEKDGAVKKSNLLR